MIFFVMNSLFIWQLSCSTIVLFEFVSTYEMPNSLTACSLDLLSQNNKFRG